MLAPVFPMNIIEQRGEPAALDRHPGRACTPRSTRSAAHPADPAYAPEKSPGTRRAFTTSTGNEPSGSTSPTTPVPQALLPTSFRDQAPHHGTGAGQWGARPLAFASRSSGWNARCSWCVSASTRSPIENHDADLGCGPASPVQQGNQGGTRHPTRKYPDNPSGSLAIAIEARRWRPPVPMRAGRRAIPWAASLNHVMLQQTLHRAAPNLSQKAVRENRRVPGRESSAAPARQLISPGSHFPSSMTKSTARDRYPSGRTDGLFPP